MKGNGTLTHMSRVVHGQQAHLGLPGGIARFGVDSSKSPEALLTGHVETANQIDIVAQRVLQVDALLIGIRGIGYKERHIGKAIVPDAEALHPCLVGEIEPHIDLLGCSRSKLWIILKQDGVVQHIIDTHPPHRVIAFRSNDFVRVV